LALVFVLLGGLPHELGQRASGATVEGASANATRSFYDFLPGHILIAVAALLGFSAFFSGSEIAFFSLHQLRLRAMSEEPGFTGRLVSAMMRSPGRLLTTILVGNTIINMLIAVLLGTRVQHYFEHAFDLSAPVAYPAAVAVVAAVLIFFGEISPKVVAVRTSETWARLACAPLRLADRVLAPVRNGLIWFTDRLFKVTRFHEVRAAPFITDEEFKAALTTGESHGVIERGERQMIQGILEFTDTKLREVLTPRPDVVALLSTASVGEALDTYREHEYSRMPVYEEDIDHITGVIVMKDLLASVAKGELDRPVSAFLRPPLFVPETMTVPQFVRNAQQQRTHLGIVVDEYGGTAGIVTLEDAVEEVVGDIMDEDEVENPPYKRIDEGVYRVEGGLPLDELNEVLRIKLEDEEHETVAGFLMKMGDRVLEPGDEVEHYGVRFVVEKCEGKRIETVRIELPPSASEGGETGEGGQES
jgi:CBS domain containing-hemolysin-like protein